MPHPSAPRRRLPRLAAAALALACGAAPARDVLLALPPEGGKLDLVAKAFRQALQQAVGGVTLVERSAAAPGHADSWELAVAVGSAGERLARLMAPAARLVSCAAPVSDAPGVVLEHDPDLQFQQLRRLLPDARRVGLLHLAREGHRRAETAAQAARRAALEPVLLPVAAAHEVQQAVEAAAAQLDALVLVPDAELLAPQVARTLLVLSMRQRLPLVGPAASWSKAGALYALDWDYEDLGRQCAEIVARMLAGKAQPGAPVAPRHAVLVVNRRAAQHLRVRLGDELLKAAQEVYD